MNKAPACSKIRTWGTIIYCRRRPTMSAKTLIAMIATVTASFAAPTMVPTVVKNYFRENMVCGMMPLSGQVAVVAGATRGAGRGIARALGEAGAVVYCTGRSVRGAPSPYGRPETIDETAEMIAAGGGKAVAVRVDHASEPEVQALVARIDRDHGRLDVLVNSIAGEEPMMRMYGSFWQTDLANADAILRQSLVSHIITSKHAAPLMIRARRGLIVEVTENDIMMAGGNPLSQAVKLAEGPG